MGKNQRKEISVPISRPNNSKDNIFPPDALTIFMHRACYIIYMERIIYGDVLFAVNFSVDFVALCITSHLMKSRSKTALLIASAAVGALYGVVSVFLKGALFINVVIAVAVALLMGYISFGRSGWRNFIVGTLIFWGVSIALGGMLTAFFTALSSGMVVYINGNAATFRSDVSPASIIAAAVIAGVFVLVEGVIAKQKRTMPKSASICLTVENKTVTAEAMVDSGCRVFDPLSGRQCLFLSKNKFRELLDESMIGFAEGNYCNFDAAKMKNIRFVPVSTVDGEGLSVGLLADSCKVDDKECSMCILCGKKDDYCGYEAIVPYEIV